MSLHKESDNYITLQSHSRTDTNQRNSLSFNLFYHVSVFLFINKENVNHVPLNLHNKNMVWSTEMCFIYLAIWVGGCDTMKSQNQVAQDKLIETKIG